MTRWSLHLKKPGASAYGIAQAREDEIEGVTGLDVALVLLDRTTEKPDRGDLLVLVETDPEDSTPTVWVFKADTPTEVTILPEYDH